jgi:alpha-D-ribose 1-methylphosphonate 5-triphosphate diphosphatase PhnM
MPQGAMAQEANKSRQADELTCAYNMLPARRAKTCGRESRGAIADRRADAIDVASNDTSYAMHL